MIVMASHMVASSLVIAFVAAATFAGPLVAVFASALLLTMLAPARRRPGWATRRGAQAAPTVTAGGLSCGAAGCGGPNVIACKARKHPCKSAAAGISYCVPRAPEWTKHWISWTLAHGGHGPSPSAGLARQAVHILDMAAVERW